MKIFQIYGTCMSWYYNILCIMVYTHTHTQSQLITLCESDESVLSKFPCYRNNAAALVPLKVSGGGRKGGMERERERER